MPRAAYALILEEIARGAMDTLHTYGNFGRCNQQFTRKHAQTAVKFYEREGLVSPVWVNHGGKANTQNLARPYSRGDVPETEEYHADLLPELGVRYVWNQKEGDLFAKENLLSELQLRDGSRLWGFSRFNQIRVSSNVEELAKDLSLPIFGKTSPDPRLITWYPNGLDLALSQKSLDALVTGAKKAIATQHFGYAWTKPPGLKFDEHGMRALSRLSDMVDRRLIAVGTVSQILDFERVHRFVEFEINRSEERVVIDIRNIRDPVLGNSTATIDSVRGLGFDVSGIPHAEIRLRGEIVPEGLVVRTGSGTRKEVGFRWWN